jgi:hypothetical protein
VTWFNLEQEKAPVEARATSASPPRQTSVPSYPLSPGAWVEPVLGAFDGGDAASAFVGIRGVAVAVAWSPTTHQGSRATGPRATAQAGGRGCSKPRGDEIGGKGRERIESGGENKRLY